MKNITICDQEYTYPSDHSNGGSCYNPPPPIASTSWGLICEKLPRVKTLFVFLGRFLDRGKEVDNLSLMSLHNWGENPSGNWNLEVQNVKRDAKQKGILLFDQ